MSKTATKVEKTGNELEYEKIAQMTESELLDYVICNSHLLSDGYYRGFDTAIYARHDELLKRRCSTKGV